MEAFLAAAARSHGFSYAIQPIAALAAQLEAAGEAFASTLLTPAEQAHFGTLHVPKRRAEWLAGRLAAKAAYARHGAAALAGPAPAEVSILSRPSRAPFIAEAPGLRLSISHCQDYAVAVVATFDIGVDLERTEARPPALARAILCPDEQKLVDNACSCPAEVDELVTCFWSRKEAVAKFLHLGGSLDFRCINTAGDQACLAGLAQAEIRLLSASYDGYWISLAL